MKSRPTRTRHPAPAPAARDWAVVALAGVAVAIAVYLSAIKIAGSSALFCESGSGCDVVQGSRYALFLGVPTAAWGALVYAAIGVLALVGLSAQTWLWAFVLSVVAVAFSGYLTFLELFVLRAICPYCVASAVVAVALLAVLAWRRPPPTSRRKFTRPAYVATIAAVTAVVTVAGAIEIFTADSSSVSTQYQQALAQHLGATGAVMYGAYW